MVFKYRFEYKAAALPDMLGFWSGPDPAVLLIRAEAKDSTWSAAGGSLKRATRKRWNGTLNISADGILISVTFKTLEDYNQFLVDVAVYTLSHAN